MGDCSGMSHCAAFHEHLQDKPAILQLYLSKYCRGESHMCARFIVQQSLSPERVPADLFPNQTGKAWTIVRNAVKEQFEQGAKS